jgi:hypothetical protein
LLGVLLLGFTVADSSALPHRTTQAGKTSAPLCRGKAKRLRPAHVSFSFECGNEDVTAFIVQANRALHFVYDPSYAFGCERKTSRSFSCEDIHSGASSVGSGLATVSDPLCHPGAHLILLITPALNFESTFRTPFTLKGPALIAELDKAGYTAAAKCLSDDLDALVVHLRYPLRHRRRWRSTNLLERSLGEVKRRTKVIGRFPGETSCLTLVWAVLDLYIGHATNGIKFTQLERQRFNQISHEGSEPTIPEEVSAA